MEESQAAVWDFDFSPNMPVQQWRKKQRRGSGKFSSSVSRPFMNRRVPKAIQTRGTPDGYYEIPSNMLIRLYYNSTTGVWPTNQINNQPTGATGYESFSLRWRANDLVIHFGNGGVINTTSTISIPGAGELFNVFDEFKQVRTEQEYWLANDPSNAHTTNASNAELWVVEDQNDAFPIDANTIQQYARSTRVTLNRPAKCTHYQKVVLDAAIDAGEGASTAAGPMINTYIKGRSNVSLLGTKCYFWIPTNASATSYVGYINIKIRVVRRYKSTI